MREKEVLKEYDELFTEMYSKIRESLESKTVDELKEIQNCFEKGWGNQLRMDNICSQRVSVSGVKLAT